MRAIFLDRDGVICENRSDHVKTWDEFQFLPRVIDSLAALSRLDLPVIVVSNQAAINRGFVSANTVEDIHRRMVAEIEAGGGRIDRVMYCPHRSDENCDCRKPQPGMLRQIAAEMDIDLTQSYLIGDAATDIMAGNRAGCRNFLVLTGRGFKQVVPALQQAKGRFTIVRDLMDAAITIVEVEAKMSARVDKTWSPSTLSRPPVISAINS
jgi:D-glycero-D-manno-heptose 1,7-bisphosphate phosphatase